jgi:hypothetical protein
VVELSRWLRRRSRKDARRLTIEAALIGGGFARYAARRLSAFLISRTGALVTHVVELTILINLFSQRALVNSLLLSNGAAIVDAFWWGALEVMRTRLRSAGRSGDDHEIRRWVTRALWLSLAMIAGTGAFVAHNIWRAGALSPLDGYALAIAARLAIDLIARAYYSGAYAHQRIYRPIAAIIAIEPIGLIVIALGWKHLGAWAFPAGLVATTIVSRAVMFHYTLRSYRMQRLVLPAPTLRRLRGRAPEKLRPILIAGCANLTTRLGATLVFGALLRVGLASEGLDRFTFTLHLISPLIGGAAAWGRVFYHDWKRLEDDLSAGLRRRLERHLVATAIAVGLTLWAMSFGTAALMLGTHDMQRELLSLLPAFLALAYLSGRQLRDFALGDFRRLTLASLLLCSSLTLALVIGGPDDPARWHLLLAGALAVGVGGLLVLDAHRRPSLHGLQSTMLSWLSALAAVDSPVSIGSARVEDGAIALRCVAERLALALGARGAVIALSRRGRLLWFERAPVTLSTAALVKSAAGTLRQLRRLPDAPDGRRALEGALAAGLVAAPPDDATSAPLVADFRRRFPDGFVVDLAARRPCPALHREPASVKRLVWQDALRAARRGGGARPRGALEITSFRPVGEIRLLFAAPRRADDAARLAWRRRLEAANWSASLIVFTPLQGVK